MFGKIIYYDKKTIDEYIALIKGKKNIQVDEYDIANDKGLKADLKVLEADAKASKSYKAKVQESLLFDCNEFERMLSGRDDYIDFCTTLGRDIATVSRGYIIKIDAIVNIPEEFDMVTLIDKFKPLLMDSIDLENTNEGSKIALQTFLGNAKATKIPVILEMDEDILCGKIVAENLIIDYSELEEFEGEEITILARSSSNGMSATSKAFYDPLKDFLSLNRMLRKQMKDMPNEFSSICADSEYKPVDILAIYR